MYATFPISVLFIVFKFRRQIFRIDFPLFTESVGRLAKFGDFLAQGGD